jgi:hypothetical protein
MSVDGLTRAREKRSSFGQELKDSRTMPSLPYPATRDLAHGSSLRFLQLCMYACTFIHYDT